MRYDYCVIGGGIVGLATARALLERSPGASLVLLEKEDQIAAHQTGHNSGVIHAGIYYAPNSLRAQLCRLGNEQTKQFCDWSRIPYETCGKLVVATNAQELTRLRDLSERATLNGITFDRLTADELRSVEPNISGLGALLVHSTGIVDFRKMASALADTVIKSGADLHTGAEVTHIRETGNEVEIRTRGESWRAGRLVVCGGLQSDRLARQAGLHVDFRIVPFRGEYFVLPRKHADLVRHLIYPVPDPALPFLGVHLTRTMNDELTVGPNAVLSFGRELYGNPAISLRDISDYVAFPGFWRLARSNWRSGLAEAGRSASKSLYLKECQRYAPSLTRDDLLPHPAGIRAQAVAKNGGLIHDFLFLQSERMLHVCNAPSPAATSALPIGELIARKINDQADERSKACGDSS